LVVLDSVLDLGPGGLEATLHTVNLLYGPTEAASENLVMGALGHPEPERGLKCNIAVLCDQIRVLQEGYAQCVPCVVIVVIPVHKTNAGFSH
jgi:hypothetical protein